MRKWTKGESTQDRNGCPDTTGHANGRCSTVTTGISAMDRHHHQSVVERTNDGSLIAHIRDRIGRSSSSTAIGGKRDRADIDADHHPRSSDDWGRDNESTAQPEALWIESSSSSAERAAQRATEHVLEVPSSIVPRTQLIRGATGKSADENVVDHGCQDTLQGTIQPIRERQGDRIDPAVRSAMETRFGADFSHVRVHTGRAADCSATQLDAHAYTVGNDIVFSRDAYDPGTDSGKAVLAHELSHVIQQSETAVRVQRMRVEEYRKLLFDTRAQSQFDTLPPDVKAYLATNAIDWGLVSRLLLKQHNGQEIKESVRTLSVLHPAVAVHVINADFDAQDIPIIAPAIQQLDIQKSYRVLEAGFDAQDIPIIAPLFHQLHHQIIYRLLDKQWPASTIRRVAIQILHQTTSLNGAFALITAFQRRIDEANERIH